MEEKKVVSLPEELSEDAMEQVSGGKESGDTKHKVTFTYRCPYCGRLFKGAKALQDHIRKEHK